MTTIHKYLLGVLLPTILWLAVGCSSGSDGEDSTTVRSVEWKISSTIGSSVASSTMLVSGKTGQSWSAEITDGADFASFTLPSQGMTSSLSGVITPTPTPNLLYIYTRTNTTNKARKAVVRFTFNGGQPVDLSMVQLAASETDDPYVKEQANVWPELPQKQTNSNYVYVSHLAELNGQMVRNYSICFDKSNRASVWVAYPYHKCYQGSAGRNELWAFDPKLPQSVQANVISRSYTNGNTYNRGHQIASQDRQANAELNAQTFYMSNMTPQLGSLNQDVWAELEGKVRGQVCSDTLYIVTGAYFGANSGATVAAQTTDNDGKICPIPTAYFKVLLRTRSGSTGKRVQDCSADELKAIGFWFDHRTYSSIPQSVSVTDIETKTGIKFFPTIPDAVKQTVTGSWNF